MSESQPMARIVLIHPPYRDPDAFPVAMASAAVKLRHVGAAVTGFDANQAFWTDWLDQKLLAEKIEAIYVERRRLEARDAIDGEDAYTYYRALNATVAWRTLLEALPEARRVLATGATTR